MFSMYIKLSRVSFPEILIFSQLVLAPLTFFLKERNKKKKKVNLKLCLNRLKIYFQI